MAKRKRAYQEGSEIAPVGKHTIKTSVDEYGNHVIRVYNSAGNEVSLIQINTPNVFYIEYYDRVLAAEFYEGKWLIQKFRLNKFERQRKGLK